MTPNDPPREAPVDTTTLFSGRADAYQRHRPGYPDTVIDLLQREVGWSTAWIVADVGAGTGISSAFFVDHGNRVVAVEPNADMRCAATQRFGARPGFRCVAGSAERTTLAGASVDVVVCATSFHWFDAPAARREFVRILRPDGYVVLMWNVRRADGSPFMAAYEAVLHRFEPGYGTRAENDARVAQRIGAFFAPSPFRQETFDNPQRLDLDGLKGRFTSASYAPLPGGQAFEPAMRALDDLWARFAVGGAVTFIYDTFVYWGRVE